MSDRRSGRSSKKVNYAAFSTGDDDDFDEDFKDVTPPPAKKAKTSKVKTSNKENNLKKQAIKNNEESSKRKPPADRYFDRELQLALEMSIHESQESTEGKDTPPPLSNEATEPFSITASVEAMEGLNKLTVEATPPVLQPITEDLPNPEVVVLDEEEPKKVSTAKSSVGNGKVFDDNIEVIGSVSEDEPKTRRRATTKKPVVDSDSESTFDPDEANDVSEESDDDYEEDNDSDFEGFSKKKTAKGKKQKTTKKQATPKSKSTTKSKTKTAPKSVAPRSKVTAVRKSVSPSVGQTMSSPVGRSLVRSTPKWTPPGSASNGKSSLGGAGIRSPGSSLGGAGTKSPSVSLGVGRIKSPSTSLGGVNIKSPLSGLRLGLSRHQSVKPLHSGFKVQH
ncbi:RAD51-associated protein 1-like [Pecten maximus]|uniref:RAD51-associated protein 1-like n=1 Tax=Pecten maximus TaxID=6579 RepID=UPI00145883BC|nr:RAD51-associated protein 1-like [Pecten maximus]